MLKDPKSMRFIKTFCSEWLKIEEMTHTKVDQELVHFQTPLLPGVPLMTVGGWGNNGHFGAGLTPLEDSSLLVYDAVNNHPLDLVPGDKVLGYDGVRYVRDSQRGESDGFRQEGDIYVFDAVTGDLLEEQGWGAVS